MHLAPGPDHPEITAAAAPITISTRAFDLSSLVPENITELGEALLGGRGKLCRMPSLEGSIFEVPANLVDPNPEQPRTYFDEAKMRETAGTLKSEGQKVAINVVPWINEAGEIRFFIVDGERRYRALTQMLGQITVRITVDWAPTLWDIHLQSLLLNDSKADHNAMERARAYNNALTKPNPEGLKISVIELAKRLGTDAPNIYSHLQLLELSPATQRLIETGALPTAGALQLKSIQSVLGDVSIDEAKLARLIIEEAARGGKEGHSKTGPRTSKGGKITQEGVIAAVRKLLLEGGDKAKAKELEADRAVSKIGPESRRTRNAAMRVVNGPRKATIQAFRNLAKNPESTRDEVRSLIEALQSVLEIAETAIKPDPLERVSGKPSFEKYIKTNQTVFKNELRTKIAFLLAENSDGPQNAITSAKIANSLEITDKTTVGANLTLLESELKTLGLVLEKHTVRRKGSDGDYQKVLGYRIAWNQEAQAPAATPAPKPVAPPAPPAPAPKPIAPPAPPAPAPKPIAPPAPPAPAPKPIAQPAPPAPAPKPVAPPAPPAPAPKPVATKPPLSDREKADRNRDRSIDRVRREAEEAAKKRGHIAVSGGSLLHRIPGLGQASALEVTSKRFVVETVAATPSTLTTLTNKIGVEEIAKAFQTHHLDGLRRTVPQAARSLVEDGTITRENLQRLHDALAAVNPPPRVMQSCIDTIFRILTKTEGPLNDTIVRRIISCCTF